MLRLPVRQALPCKKACNHMKDAAANGGSFELVDLDLASLKACARVPTDCQQLAAEGKGPFQWKAIPQGAATSVWAGVAAPADEIGGRYCENCHVGQIVADHVTISAVSEGVRGYALDPKNAEALWKKSEELVGESF